MKQTIQWMMLFIVLTLGAGQASAQSILKDIWVGVESSSPKEFTKVGGSVYFAADNGSVGIELWKTDGTEAGTVLVRDINPYGNSDPSWMASSGSLVFFRANDGVNGDEVWVSDGTAAGTRLTMDIYPGSLGSHPEHIYILGDYAYFMAVNDVVGAELYRSNGTTTELVMDINPGVESSSPHWAVELNGKLFFRADDGVHGEELWMTDGVTTEMVVDLNPGIAASHPERLTVMNGWVYFPAIHASFGSELWRSNGTTTEMVKDINPGIGDGEPKELVNSDGRLFFAAENGTTGAELWTSDGTAAGTYLVRDIRVGDSPSLPTNLTAVGSEVYFSANDGTKTGTALWKSDGTETGTVMVKDIRKTGEPAFQFFTAVDDFLMFTSNDGAHGVELWQSNGTEGGTFMVEDISRGHSSASPLSLTSVDGSLYFTATNSAVGREPWIYTPSISPTAPVLADDVATVEMNEFVMIDVLANDRGERLVILEVADPPHGTAEIAGDLIRYTPDPDYVGTDVFEYTVSDAHGLTAIASVTVNVIAANTPPTISEIADQQTNEDTPLTEVHFTVGDAESNLMELAVTAISSDQSVVPDATIYLEGGASQRSITIVPAANASGSTTITLTVSDGIDEASTSFELTVLPVNDAPAIQPIADQTTAEGAPLEVPFSVEDIDGPGGITISAVSSDQSLLPNESIATDDGIITLMPAAGRSGTVLVTVTASDGLDSSDETFLLTVTSVDAPFISQIADQVIMEGLVVGPIPFTVSDSSTPADQLVVTAASSNEALLPAANITLAGTGGDRTITLVPVAGERGESIVTVRVVDLDEHEAAMFFKLTVTESGVPIALDDVYSFVHGETLFVPADKGVLINDTDPEGRALSAVLGSAPERGTLTLNADGSFTFVAPTTGGRDEAMLFTYTATNGEKTSNVATVTLRPGGNTPPLIDAIGDQVTDEDIPLELTGVSITDAESHGEELVISFTSTNVVLLPVAGIEVHGGGSMRVIKLLPVHNASGTTTVTISASDGEYVVEESFTLTVRPVNDRPTITSVEDQTTAENVPVGPLAITIGDVETAPGELTLSASSSNQVLLPDGNIEFGGDGAERTVLLTPAANQGGTAVVTLTVSDEELSSAVSFTLTVTSVDAPSITAIEDVYILENQVAGPIAFVVDDLTTPPADLVLQASADNITLLPEGSMVFGGEAGNRTITLTPAADESGVARVTVTVTDGEGNQASTTFRLTVGAENQPPIAMNDAYLLAGESLIVGAVDGVLSNDSDPNGDPLTATLLTPPSTGTLTFNSDGSFSYVAPPHEQEVTIAAPPEEEEETISFTYVADDGELQSNVATVTISTESGPQISQIDDLTTYVGETVAPGFTVRPGHATITARSSNQSVLPNNGITISEGGRNRTLTLVPTSAGATIVTVEVSAESGEASMNFALLVLPADGPRISSIDDVVVYKGQSVDPITFVVGDNETPSEQLKIEVATDNEDLLPSGNIATAGEGGSRSVILNPTAGKTGMAVVTVTVEDADGNRTSSSFRIEVLQTGTPVAVDDYYAGSGSEQLVVSAADGVLANDSDPDGDLLTAVLETAPSEGSLALNPDGSFIYIPAHYEPEISALAEGESGAPEEPTHPPLTFTYRASDGLLMSPPATVSLALEHEEEPGIDPIADQEIDEGEVMGPVTFKVKPGHLVVTAVSDNQDLVSNDLIDVVGDGPHGRGRQRHITIYPRDDAFGTATITLTGTIDRGETVGTQVTRTFNLLVRNVDDVPIAVADTATTSEDSAVRIDVLANDIDIDGDVLRVTAVTEPSHGRVSIVEEGAAVEYRAYSDYAGTDDFSYEFTDGTSTLGATVHVVIREVNDQPKAKDDVAEVDEDEEVIIDVLANDGDDDGDELTASLITKPTNGTAEVTDEATVRYRPNSNFFGEDSFQYRVSDGKREQDATVKITVHAVNDPPIAVADTASTPEGSPLEVDALANDTDVDGDELTIVAITEPGHGRAELTERKQVRYRPAEGHTGADVLTYVVSDGSATDTATIYVEVVLVNDAPVALADTAYVDEDESVVVDVLANDRDGNDDDLSILEFEQASHGAVVQVEDGLKYTPARDYFGADQFAYVVTDGSKVSEAVVYIIVQAVNDPPVAVADTVVTAENEGVAVNAAANDTDADGDVLTVRVVSQPANGTAAVTSEGIILYQPTQHFSGADRFEYEVSDGQAVAKAFVEVTVEGRNDAPVAVADSVDTEEDVPVVVRPLANDVELDGDPLWVVGIGKAAHGVAVLTDSVSIRYTPTQDYNGSDSFAYFVTDGSDTSEAYVHVAIAAVPDPPGHVYLTLSPETLRVFVNGSPDDRLVIKWEPVTDPDGDRVMYTWNLAFPDDSDHKLLSLNVEYLTEVSITYAELARLMDEHVSKAGEPLTLMHWVVSSDGRLEDLCDHQKTIVLTRGLITGREDGDVVPTAVTLEQNYPNPFNPRTVVRYAVPQTGEVDLRVFDALGREVWQLVHDRQPAGWYSVEVDLGTLSSGLYLYRLETQGRVKVRTMLLVK